MAARESCQLASSNRSIQGVRVEGESPTRRSLVRVSEKESPGSNPGWGAKFVSERLNDACLTAAFKSWQDSPTSLSFPYCMYR